MEETIRVRKATFEETVTARARVRSGTPSGVAKQDGLPLPQSRANQTLQGRDLNGQSFYELAYKRNAMIYALINLRCVALQMARLVALDENDKPVEGSALVQLLANPNPDQTWSQLITQIEAYLLLGGAAYLYKVRDGAGVVMEVYCYNTSQITPVGGMYRAVEYYRYDNGAGNVVSRIEPTDVVRLTHGMHSWTNPAKHVSPLAPLASLIDTDNEAISASLALVTRGAVPAALIELPPKKDALGGDMPYSQQQLVEYKQLYETSFGGQNRGSNMVGPPGTKVHVMGFDPKRMMTREFSTIPETRACEVMGVPVQMTSFWSSSMAKTYANYGEARLSFYQDTMIPHSIMVAEMLNAGFADEIFRTDRRVVRLAFDWSRAQTIQNYVADKLTELYKNNAATLNQTLTANGLPEDANYGDKYLFELLSGQTEGSSSSANNGTNTNEAP